MYRVSEPRTPAGPSLRRPRRINQLEEPELPQPQGCRAEDRHKDTGGYYAQQPPAGAGAGT
jgi:hypothetical protein